MEVFAIGLLALTLLVPAAQATPERSAGHGLRAQLVLPVVFGPFQGCTDGASYGIVADKRTGSGTTCLLTAPDFSPCSEGIGLCRDLATHTVLSLGQKGTVELDANQHEAITAFDPFSVEITWTGTVTAGTRSFHKFIGADVGGGGLTSFAASGTQTGQLEFVIGEPRDKG